MRQQCTNGAGPPILSNLLVPGERIELPTNGLQNRCSTAELTRLECTAISLARLPQAAPAWSAACEVPGARTAGSRRPTVRRPAGDGLLALVSRARSGDRG